MVSFGSQKCKYTQVRGLTSYSPSPGRLWEGRVWTDMPRILSREKLALKVRTRSFSSPAVNTVLRILAELKQHYWKNPQVPTPAASSLLKSLKWQLSDTTTTFAFLTEGRKAVLSCLEQTLVVGSPPLLLGEELTRKHIWQRYVTQASWDSAGRVSSNSLHTGAILTGSSFPRRWRLWRESRLGGLSCEVQYESKDFPSFPPTRNSWEQMWFLASRNSIHALRHQNHPPSPN